MTEQQRRAAELSRLVLEITSRSRRKPSTRRIMRELLRKDPALVEALRQSIG